MQCCHIVVIIPPHIYTEILIEIRQKLWASFYTNICQPLYGCHLSSPVLNLILFVFPRQSGVVVVVCGPDLAG